jgi:hypothetical protein
MAAIGLDQSLRGRQARRSCHGRRCHRDYLEHSPGLKARLGSYGARCSATGAIRCRATATCYARRRNSSRQPVWLTACCRPVVSAIAVVRHGRRCTEQKTAHRRGALFDRPAALPVPELEQRHERIPGARRTGGGGFGRRQGKRSGIALCRLDLLGLERNRLPDARIPVGHRAMSFVRGDKSGAGASSTGRPQPNYLRKVGTSSPCARQRGCCKHRWQLSHM